MGNLTTPRGTPMDSRYYANILDEWLNWREMEYWGDAQNTYASGIYLLRLSDWFASDYRISAYEILDMLKQDFPTVTDILPSLLAKLFLDAIRGAQKQSKMLWMLTTKKSITITG